MTPSPAFRVLARDGGEAVVVDREDYEPLTVADPGLLPGYGVDAAVEWSDPPELADVTVVERTLIEFVDGASNLFEDALDAAEEARQEGVGVNSRVTYGQDGEPNGALYTFADGPGASVFREFRSGSRPLEPLVERVERPPPYEVFVLRPATRPFVVVYIVFEKESVLADTVRDTYGCPRPPEEV
ncbi:MAG: DUF6663 family protein [Halobacteriaceae archaeon]